MQSFATINDSHLHRGYTEFDGLIMAMHSCCAIKIGGILRIFFFAAVAASIISAGCSQKPVEVIITATEYRVNDITSPLATTVVDEVVRMKPKHVIFISCLNTPPEKILQFDRELVARINPKIQMAVVEKKGHAGCP